jgi:hypothetical protein
MWAQINPQIDYPSAEVLKAARNRRWIKRLKDYDSSILAAAGITLDDFVRLIIAHEERISGGSQSRRTKEWVAMRDAALLAIRDADLKGCTWKETIDAALGACSSNGEVYLDRKTVDRWLRVLHEWGDISIDPPKPRGRGRPKRNS